MGRIKKYISRIVIAIKNIKRAEKPQDQEARKRSLWRLWLLPAAAVLIAVIIIFAWPRPSPTPLPSSPTTTPAPEPTGKPPPVSPPSQPPEMPPTPSPTPQPSPTVQPEIEKGLLILSHTTFIDKYGYFHLIGEVENLGEGGTEHNRIRADFYDDQGTIYSTGTGECFRELIGPGGKSPFEVVLSKAPETLTYKLTALSQSTENLPAGGFSFTEISPESGVDSEYIVKGMIRNDSSHDIEAALILGTFYDNDGNVTAIGFTFPDIIPIQPGGSSEFTMTVDFHGSPIASFALHAETSS